jgi:single-stranded DNA-binding protein
MPSVGDRVVFEGNKVGGARREGELLAVEGRLVRVRWGDGTESTLFPGAGAMRVLPRRKAAGGRASEDGGKARTPAAAKAKKKRG